MLTGELIQHGLSDLGRTGDGTKIAYLTLTLSVSLKPPHSLLEMKPFFFAVDLLDRRL